MPAISYSRIDHAIRIVPSGETAEVRLTGQGGVTDSAIIPRETLDRAARGDDGDLRLAWPTWATAGWAPVQWDSIFRLTIDVGERAWAAIAFESLLPVPGWLVRTSAVHPRISQTPLAFPIRILETGAPAVVRDAIEQTFGGTYREHVFVDGQTTLRDAEAFLRAAGWPTVEILDIHDLAGGESLLSMAAGGESGTAGWLLRLADRFQTRLVVIDGDRADLPRLRVLAQSIIDRGGPAVWLFDRALPRRFGFNNDPAHQELYVDVSRRELYGDVAHDRPLDWIRGGLPGELFAGPGAEEALRYSTIGVALAQLALIRDVVGTVQRTLAAPSRMVRQVPRTDDVVAAITDTARVMRIPIEASTISTRDLWGTRAERFGDALSARLTRQGLAVAGLDVYMDAEWSRGADITIDGLVRHVESTALPLRSLTRQAAAELFTSRVQRIGEVMAGYVFEDHESEGMLPLAGKVMDARALVEVLGAKSRRRTTRPRHVNIGFSTVRSDRTLEHLAQARARLRPEEVVHLGVRIAPKDERIATLGSTAFLEEVVRPTSDGVWIEVGVTAIDFDLLGDPVQEVWLPREDPTDLVTFAVRPRATTTVPRVARLRVSIHHRNNLVQSFMVAALLEGASGDLAAALARALNATPAAVRRLGGVGYLTRLEYATVPVSDAGTLEERGLTIIANDSAGDKVVTLKGDDLFSVIADPLLPDKVEAARAALDRASRRGATYRFTHGNQANHGDPAELLELLGDMADAGFDLFNTLVRKEEDKQRVARLVARGDGIHAAHIDAASVIPWSLVYDRVVRLTTREWSENAADPQAPVYPVTSAVCPAGLPAADGTLPDGTCGGVTCLLDPAANEQRKRSGAAVYREETVICARRFWGFATTIEVPAQQAKGLAQAVRRIQPTIKAGRPMTVLGGFNPNLEFAQPHADELKATVFTTTQGAVPTSRATLVQPARGGPGPLRQLLLQSEPDIVYFFCHALASLTDGAKTLGPTLDFGRGYEGVAGDVLAPKEFAGQAWTHAPLVFINGCSTAGFSPYAPSEFIKQFIQGRAASAVIGTEVTVWEVLATEVARTFLLAFLDGKSAGEALLLARRALLVKHNPLGLVYTLYGSAGLTLGALVPSTAAVTPRSG